MLAICAMEISCGACIYLASLRGVTFVRAKVTKAVLHGHSLYGIYGYLQIVSYGNDSLIQTLMRMCRNASRALSFVPNTLYGRITALSSKVVPFDFVHEDDSPPRYT